MSMTLRRSRGITERRDKSNTKTAPPSGDGERRLFYRDTMRAEFANERGE
jgi:hypothetical protein